MIISELQAQIDATDYWDMKILDFETKYFGDEVSMLIDNDDETIWKLTFLTCLNVSYETDAAWRGFPNVKVMKGSQLCYYGQDISVTKNQDDDTFAVIKMDLSIMNVEITFKEMLVEKISRDSVSLFWC